MKIILRQDVKKLGKKGAAVEVKDGFARNFLIPRGVALAASPANLKAVEKQLEAVEDQSRRDKKEAEGLARRLSDTPCTICVDAGKEDKLYGSITTAQIIEALAGEGITLDKKQLILDNPIKALGIYDLAVQLHPEVTAKLKVWVVKR